jgi:Helix-turn-helix domain
VSSQVHPGRPGIALGHPLRVALLGLLARRATLTSTEAARELGESSGACSFHLRQLARYGHVEEAPGAGGRARPWRLVTTAKPAGQGLAGSELPGGEPAGGQLAGSELAGGDEFGALARELENEGYRRWLSDRAAAPPGWRDEAFSTVLQLTPEELTEVAAAIRGVIAAYAGRPGPDPRPGAGAGGGVGPGGGAGAGGGAGGGGSAGAAGVLPVAVVARMFPLLPAGPDPAAPAGGAEAGQGT